MSECVSNRPVLPIIVTVALLVECQPNGGAVSIFPLTGEDMAVSGLTRHRWRKGIRGDISMNRRLGASCCEQCAGEKKRHIPHSRPRRSTISGQELSFDRSCVLHSPLSCNRENRDCFVIRWHPKSRQVATHMNVAPCTAFAETMTSAHICPWSERNQRTGFISVTGIRSLSRANRQRVILVCSPSPQYDHPSLISPIIWVVLSVCKRTSSPLLHLDEIVPVFDAGTVRP